MRRGRRRFVAIWTAFVLLVPSGTMAQEGGTREAALLVFAERLEDVRSELIDVRRDIHRHPELSGEEERTAGIVADRLKAAGFEVRTGVGGHGVVGLLRGDTSGPLLAFRADMDAVRSSAPDPVDFRSEVEGVRHICGHDIHTTVGLALAEGFSSVRDRLRGSVMLIFQPAEESATGARAMLADGAFADPRPDAIFAYHTAPFEIGQIATASRGLLPGRDAVHVTIRGAGDLEGAAQAARDLVLATGTVPPEAAMSSIAGEFVLVQGARAMRDSKTEGWVVRATLSTSSRESSARARRAIEEGLAELQSAGEELNLDLDYRERFVAGVTNDPDLVELANASARAELGDDAVWMLEEMPPAFSEDFGSFQEEVPGVMYFLGVSNAERGWVGMPHTPDYVADEEAIFVGARTMGAVFLDLLERGWRSGR